MMEGMRKINGRFSVGNWIAIITVALAAGTVVFAAGRSAGVNSKVSQNSEDIRNLKLNVIQLTSSVDRNCRILQSVLADTRFIIIQHAGDTSQETATDFRQIFRDIVKEQC